MNGVTSTSLRSSREPQRAHDHLKDGLSNIDSKQDDVKINLAE